MKKVYLLALLMIFCNVVFAQQPPSYTFEPPYGVYKGEFILDSTNSRGSWQIGRPQKAVFDSAYTYPNVIVTDTVNSYPINDTSVFVFKVNNRYDNGIGRWYVFTGLFFRYKLEIDSGEIAKIEFSTDSGTHWVNILDEDTTYDIDWAGRRPDLTKSTSSWEYFGVDFYKWVFYNQSKYSHYINGDTTYVRFTFISDSIQTNKDGWMIDNIGINQYTESVADVSNNNLISIYPNPAKEHIYIKANYNYYAVPKVTIYDRLGRVVLAEQNVPSNNYLSIDLPNGVYTLKYATDTEVVVKQIVISK